MIDWMRIVSQLNLVCLSYSVQYAVRTNCVRALPYLRAAIHVADYSSGLKKKKLLAKCRPHVHSVALLVVEQTCLQYWEGCFNEGKQYLVIQTKRKKLMN